MELLLKRTWLSPQSTIGELFVDGVHECFILEDRYRPPGEAKVPGRTAIPNGRYEVRITWSPRFQCEMPLLIGVPNYEGVRIHAGTTADDTEGCLLPGCRRGVDQVFESRVADRRLFAKLKDARGPTFITVTT